MSPFEAAADRRGAAADLLVLGLGNPGLEYARSRHNAGADCVQVLARRHGVALKSSRKERSDVAELRPGGARLIVAFPTTFYNEVGGAAAALVRRHGIDTPEKIVVVHDEMDLEPGRLKLKRGGGLAGNNGLKSVKAALKTEDFLRVRIGVGKPPGSQHGKDHVLRRPGKRERDEIDVAIEEAADAVELILAEGIDRAMERYNRKS